MLPAYDILPPTTRIELQYLSERCVRLVGWTSFGRGLVLTADPRDAEDLQRLLEIPAVFFRAQAGSIWTQFGRPSADGATALLEINQRGKNNDESI